MILEIKRVLYGNKNTPKDLREYTIKGTLSPVGTLKEFESFADKNGYTKIEILKEGV